jgi:hypothetical protein
MNEIAFLTLVYGLGAIGLFAIGAMPMRALWLWRTSRDGDRRLAKVRIAILLAAIALSAMFITKIARCLLGFHCSATGAGGWLFSAAIGAIYLTSEALQAIAAKRLVVRRDR